MHHLLINASSSTVTVLGFGVIRDGFALNDTVISDHKLAFLAKVGATASHVDIFVEDYDFLLIVFGAILTLF